ncbi:MAG: hypothetical protein ACRD6X_19320 [Pyrinomonadaceae bacterium]
MHNGLLIGSQYVHVDLPQSKSADVFQVFTEKPFANRGGGSGPSSPIIHLSAIRKKDPSRLFFTLKNPTEKPIYVPRIPSSKGSSYAALAHFLVCQDYDGGPIYVLASGPEFEQTPWELKGNGEVSFSLKRPIAKTCFLIVPYDFWEAPAQRLADDGFLRNTDLYTFSKYLKAYVTYRFELSEFDCSRSCGLEKSSR